MAINALSRLCLVRVKVERAKKHLSELEQELIDWGYRERTVVVRECEPNTGNQIGNDSFRTLPEIPFDVIAASGDVIQNLRSSLDHLAYQLVMVGTSDAGPSSPRRIQFPIAADLVSYDSRKARQVDGMREDARLAIDAAKPYRGGNDALWRIHELNNIDKHRCLLTVSNDHHFVAEWLPGSGMGGYRHKAKEINFSGVFGDEEEKGFQLEIHAALRKAETTYGDALLPTLHQLVGFTDKFVKDFLPFLE